LGVPNESARFRLPDGSRSTQSPWVWRGFLLMSLIGLGLCISFVVGRETGYAIAWAVITIGWFATAMWLWRKHVRWDDETWAAAQRAAAPRSRATKPGGAARVTPQAGARPGKPRPRARKAKKQPLITSTRRSAGRVLRRAPTYVRITGGSSRAPRDDVTNTGLRNLRAT
jgi:hypothetical protein